MIAKNNLIEKFSLSEIQADSILNLRLKYLAKLEEIKITSEQNGLDLERIEIEEILNDKNKLKDLIKQEI